MAVCGPATGKDKSTKAANEPSSYSNFKKSHSSASTCFSSCAWSRWYVSRMNSTTTSPQVNLPNESHLFLKSPTQLCAHMCVLWGWMSLSCIWRTALQTCTTLHQEQNNKWRECWALASKYILILPAASCHRIPLKNKSGITTLDLTALDSTSWWQQNRLWQSLADSSLVFTMEQLVVLYVNGDWLPQ